MCLLDVSPRGRSLLETSHPENEPTMSKYPDLASSGIRAMQFSFHVTRGLEAIEAFWEERGLDRSKERLLLAGYTRNGHPHTVYLNWARSHERCCDVNIGIEARRPSQVWPGRQGKSYRLNEEHFRKFIDFVIEQEVPWGIRARYTYPSPGPIIPARTKESPNFRLKSLSLEVIEDGRAAAQLTYDRQGMQWFAIVEPTAGYPFPKGDFFQEPLEMGRTLLPISTEQTT